MITDLGAWRRVCLKAFDNLRTDTGVTVGQVDQVLTAGARDYVAWAAFNDRVPGYEKGSYATLTKLTERVAETTGVNASDVDAILCWASEDAAPLIVEQPDDVEVFDEWRVTGEPGPFRHRGEIVGTFPSYTFIWSKYQGPDPNNPEGAAREFVARITERNDWTDGPHLDHRTITRGPWRPAGDS